MRLVRIQDGDDVLIIDPSEIVSLAGCDILFRNGQIAHTTEGLAKKLGDRLSPPNTESRPNSDTPELPQLFRCSTSAKHLDLRRTIQNMGCDHIMPHTVVHGTGAWWPEELGLIDIAWDIGPGFLWDHKTYEVGDPRLQHFDIELIKD